MITARLAPRSQSCCCLTGAHHDPPKATRSAFRMHRPTKCPTSISRTGASNDAIGKLDVQVADLMRTAGIPVLAVAAVHGGKALYTNGFGVRYVRPGDKVDGDTVFTRNRFRGHLRRQHCKAREPRNFHPLTG
jgi:CubicO group peptidase (beta-lactamase class C family)